MRGTFQRRDVRHDAAMDPAVMQLLLAVTEIQRRFIGEQDPPRQFAEALSQLLMLTGSEYGFIGEVNRDSDGTPWLSTHAVTDIAWDAATREFYDQNIDDGLQFHDLDNLFGTVVRTRQTVIANSPDSDPRSTGRPEGHPPLKSFLGIPFHFGGELVGMLGIANRDGGYSEELVEWLEPLTTTCATMIVAVRSERQRQAAEQSLRESEEHFRQIADLTTEVTFVAGISASNEPRLWSLHGNLEKVFGVPEQDAARLAWKDHVHTDDLPLIETLVETARSRHVAQTVVRWLRPAGETRYLQIAARISPTSPTAAVSEELRIDGCVTDVSAALESERKMQGIIQRHQAILHAVPDLMFLMTRDGRFLDSWTVDESRLLVSRDEFIGRQHREFLPPEVCDQWDDAVRGVGTSGTVCSFEYSLQINQEAHWYEARVVSCGDRRESVLTVSRDITERRNAEEAEARQFELLKEISRSTRELIFVKDTDRRMLFVNDATAGIVGAAVDEILGKTNDELFPEPTARMTAESDLQVLATGQSLICEQAIPTVAGERYFITSKSPWRSLTGELLGLIGIAQDVTDLKEANRELEFSRQFAERIAEASPHIVYVFDIVEQRILYSNRLIAEDLGYSPDEIREMGDEFLPGTLHPDDLAQVPAMLARWETAQDGDILEHEYRMRSASDEWRWFLARDTVFLRGRDGRVQQTVGTAQDITDRVRAQQALQESEARLRAIIESEPECVKLVARDGTLLEINAAGLRYTGAESLEDVIGRCVFDMIAPEYQQQFREFHEMVCDGQPGALEMEIVGLKGERRRMETHAVPLKYGPNGEIGHLAVTRDVTEVRNAEDLIAQQHAQLLHVSRLSSLGQMMATISHEITQPLSAISNYAAACRLLLKRPDPNLETVVRHIETIVEQTHRTGETLDRIRTFVRGGCSARQLCDLDSVISEALSLMKAELRNRRVRVAFHAPTMLPQVMVDHIQIKQVITNLIMNACDAMQDQLASERKIDITCRQHSDDLVVSVEDTGLGLNGLSQDKLFEAFCTSKSEGMGLGLAICRDIVTAHGGTISAANSLHGGAVFQFTLPVANEGTHA